MKKIILGISSSISAYKACDLIRLFVKAGYSVYTVVTENALNPAMRYSGNETTFYPQDDIFKFSYGAYKDGKIESFLINVGNSETLSEKQYSFWNCSR